MKAMTSKTNKLITCIYCRETKSSSTEHVIPQALGGNLTIQCVCEGCNTGMSSLDQSLVDKSVITLVRIVRQPGAVLTSGALFKSTGSGDHPLEIRVGHQYRPETMAQLIFVRKGDGTYDVHGAADTAERFKALFSVLRKMRTKKGLAALPILRPLKGETPDIGPRIVLNRSSAAAFRPSSAEADAKAQQAEITQLIEKKFNEIEAMLLDKAARSTRQRVDQPILQLNLSMDFGRNLRAVAKVGLNFVVAVFGHEVALFPAFDGVRKYARHGEGADDPGCLWAVGSGDGRSMTATRYAIWMKDFCTDQTAMRSPNTHVITLHQRDDRLCTLIEFYGQVAFGVDLGNIQLLDSFPLVYEFDYIKRTHRQVTLKDITRCILTKFAKASQNKTGSPI